jgi:hypothetical protein
MSFRNIRNQTLYASLMFFLLISGFFACRFQAVRHSPVRAASDANKFLKALYYDEDYVKALELSDEQLRNTGTVENLKQMVEQMKQKRGKLKQLWGDSYLMTQGATIELFYVGDYDQGISYHRVVLVGDASSGYRVSGIWFQHEPYPQQSLRRKFDVDVVVGRL